MRGGGSAERLLSCCFCGPRLQDLILLSCGPLNSTKILVIFEDQILRSAELSSKSGRDSVATSSRSFAAKSGEARKGAEHVSEEEAVLSCAKQIAPVCNAQLKQESTGSRNTFTAVFKQWLFLQLVFQGR